MQPDYSFQPACVDRIWERITTGGVKKLVATAPCGAGKTNLLVSLFERELARGGRPIVYTNRKTIRSQISARLDQYGVDHGIRASGYAPNFQAAAQVSSIQTEVARSLNQFHPWDLRDSTICLVDEAHSNRSRTARQIIDFHVQSGCPVVGLTATPVGLGEVYDELLILVNKTELRKRGVLVPCDVFAGAEIDLADVDLSADGDFVQSQVQARFEGVKWAVYGEVMKWYNQLNPHRKPTILFAPGVPESKWFAQHLTANGIRTEHVDAETRDSDREAVFARLESGETDVLTNYAVVCLDSETEILTSSGWVGIDDMTEKHKVANWFQGIVWFDHPRRIVRRQRAPNEDMVSVKTRRLNIRLTADHQMVYKTWKIGSFKKKPARDLVGKVFHLPVSGRSEPLPIVATIPPPRTIKHHRRRVAANSFIYRHQHGMSHSDANALAESRLSDAAQLKRKQPSELTTDECWFIGFWLGDGSKTRLSKGGVEYSICQDVESIGVIDTINARIAACGYDSLQKLNTAGNSYKWSFPRGTGFGPQRRRGLYPIEPYLRRDTYRLLWGLDEEQFDSLLDGLWTADGNHGADGIIGDRRRSRRIDSIDKHMLDELQAIAVCRGYRAVVHVRKQSPRSFSPGKVIYNLSFWKASSIAVAGTRPSIEPVWRSERVWCVTCDSGNIIVRRHGNAFVTGNCEGFDLPAASCCLLCRPTRSVTVYEQAVGRVLRAAPGKERATLIDFCGCWHTPGLGSPNRDREWELTDTNRTISKEEKRDRENRDAGEEKEPARCPQCGRILKARVRDGYVCTCGYKFHRSVRMVIQLDGTLERKVGSTTKRKAPKDDTHFFRSAIFAAANSRKPMTVGQCYGMACAKKGGPISREACSIHIPEKGSVGWHQLAKDVYPWACSRKAAAAPAE